MKTLIQEIKVAKQRTDGRRKEWNEKSKAIIFNTLNKAVNELGVSEIGGFVKKSQEPKNLEAVGLSFGIDGSGIVEKTNDGGSRAFTKINGCITFSQLISGHVAVIYKSSYIEGIGREPVEQIKEKIDPSEVTEAWVLDHVRNFLIEFKEYEESWI